MQKEHEGGPDPSMFEPDISYTDEVIAGVDGPSEFTVLSWELPIGVLLGISQDEIAQNDAHVATLGMPLRIHRCLIQVGITSISQIQSLTFRELLRVPRLSIGPAYQIVKKIANFCRSIKPPLLKDPLQPQWDDYFSRKTDCPPAYSNCRLASPAPELHGKPTSDGASGTSEAPRRAQRSIGWPMTRPRKKWNCLGPDNNIRSTPQIHNRAKALGARVLLTRTSRGAAADIKFGMPKNSDPAEDFEVFRANCDLTLSLFHSDNPSDPLYNIASYLLPCSDQDNEYRPLSESLACDAPINHPNPRTLQDLLQTLDRDAMELHRGEDLSTHNPLMLLDDWNIFAGFFHPNDDRQLRVLRLPAGIHKQLRHNGAARLSDILVLTLPELTRLVGDAPSAIVLDALVEYAMSRRLAPERQTARSPDYIQFLPAPMVKQWSQLPMKGLEFSPAETRKLKKLGFTSIVSIQNNLPAIYAEVGLDITFFTRVCDALAAHGCLRGNAVDRFVAIRGNLGDRSTLDNKILPIRKRFSRLEWTVACIRYGLKYQDSKPPEIEAPPFRMPVTRAEWNDYFSDPKKAPPAPAVTRDYSTLRELANDLGLNRERIRQIESRVQKKSRAAPEMKSLANTLELFIKQQGGISTIAEIGKILREWMPGGESSHNGLCHLCLEIFPERFFRAARARVYGLVDQPCSLYREILRRGTHIVSTTPARARIDEVAASIARGYLTEGVEIDKTFVLACLRTDDRFKASEDAHPTPSSFHHPETRNPETRNPETRNPETRNPGTTGESGL